MLPTSKLLSTWCSSRRSSNKTMTGEKEFAASGAVFLVGFDNDSDNPSFSSLVANWNAKCVQSYKEQWCKSNSDTMFYGKCTTQTISLPGRFATKQVEHSLESLILDKQVVHTTSDNSNQLPTINASYFKTDAPESLESTTILDDDTCSTCFPTMLRNDAVAQELANKYKAGVVTTKETLETLLQLPPPGAKWMIPLCTENKIVWLDLPIPQPGIPRRCLTRGYQTVLYDGLSSPNTRRMMNRPPVLHRSCTMYNTCTPF